MESQEETKPGKEMDEKYVNLENEIKDLKAKYLEREKTLKIL